MGEEYPQSRSDLLARVAAARTKLDAFIATLTETQINAPEPDGDWSIKDHLYHLGAWERKVLAHTRGESIPVALGIDQATWDRDEIDEINAAIQARSCGLPVCEMLAYFEQAHRDLLAAITRFPEADLVKPGYPDEPDGAPMVAYIAGNTYKHFAEHLGYMR